MPILDPRHLPSRRRRPVPFITWRVLICSIVAVLSACALRAQEIQIKVLDGRSGRPVANKCINVWVGGVHGPALLIATDREGIASLHLTADTTKVSPGRPSSVCGTAVVDPVVRSAKTLEVTSATGMLCQAHPPDSPWLSFSVRKILDSGDVTANVCGKFEASPKPGELIFFQRPRTFWERLRE